VTFTRPPSVRVTRDGYAAQDRRVVLSSSRPSQSVNVAMVRTPAPPPSRSAAAAASAAGGHADDRPRGRGAGRRLAADWARGVPRWQTVGTTPLMVPSVAAGDHAIRIELDGYRPWSSSVRMVAAESNRVRRLWRDSVGLGLGASRRCLKQLAPSP
jgi:hypothetical protein